MHVGGLLDPRGAAVHPLNLMRGLARGLGERGVPIFVRTPARWNGVDSRHAIVDTPRARIRADHLIIATNAYTDRSAAFGDLDRRIVSIDTSAIATAPIGDNLAAEIIPGGHCVTDSRRVMFWARKLGDGRLVFGGRGNVGGVERPAAYAGLERAMCARFPQLAGLPVLHRWSGRIAVTLDDFPHIGRLGERSWFAMGYGGRGLALATLLGKWLARGVLGEPVDAGPMSDARFRPIPFHGLRRPAARALVAYYRFLDWRTAAR
jgi:glycine/D-amino acid oxidase-like deaminating enzyme